MGLGWGRGLCHPGMSDSALSGRGVAQVTLCFQLKWDSVAFELLLSSSASDRE